MTPERFETFVGAYGGAIERWPRAEQAAARLLLAADPALSAVLEREAALDAVLDDAQAPVIPSALVGRILQSAPEVQNRRRTVRRWLAGVGLGLGLAAAAVGGVMVGAALYPHPTDDSLVAAVADAGVIATEEGV